MKNHCFRFSTVFLALLLLGAAAGCAWQDAAENIERSRSLRIGMNKAEVLAVMGEPQQNEEYSAPDVWYYYCQPVWIDGLVTEDECMPVVFQDGKLIGWGNEFYARRQLLPKIPAKNQQ